MTNDKTHPDANVHGIGPDTDGGPNPHYRPPEHKCPPEVADEHKRAVCEGMYIERTDELLGLVEALQAIIGLCGGHDEQSKAITKIAEDAIAEYAWWTQ